MDQIGDPARHQSLSIDRLFDKSSATPFKPQPRVANHTIYRLGRRLTIDSADGGDQPKMQN